MVSSGFEVDVGTCCYTSRKRRWIFAGGITNTSKHEIVLLPLLSHFGPVEN
jgi:hypothetical protein